MADHRDLDAGIRLAQDHQRLTLAAQDTRPALDLTHSLYRYPASLSPAIAHELICCFAPPGGTVLDPFCGGGTTAIEAIANGRRTICSDLNNLAVLVTRSKATPLRSAELSQAADWLSYQASAVLTDDNVRSDPLVTSDGGAFAPRTHAILLALADSARGIQRGRTRRFLQLVALRTGQLCFDGKQRPLSPFVLLRAFRKSGQRAIAKMREYSDECHRYRCEARGKRRISVYCSDAEHLPSRLGDRMADVDLVLTSPPYPGIHVLYHRWQFRGRKEIPLPYRVAGLVDGAYESYYTLGSRKEKSHRTYFDRIHKIFSNLNSFLRRGTPIAQVVAFSEPAIQFPEYLAVMASAGYDRIESSEDVSEIIQRSVPNRKWYARTRPIESEVREYVLLHRSTG